MRIPTRADQQLGELENEAAALIVSIKTLHWSREWLPEQRDRQRRLIRGKLQDFADAVIEHVNGIET